MNTVLMLDLTTLARSLGGEVSSGQVLAPGPGHSPTDRSLSVRLDAGAPDGFLVHSFANDDPIACRDHVRTKAGLPAFRPNGGNRHQRLSRVVAAYDYTDADGALLYQVIRCEPKDFRQRRPDGSGGWINQLGDITRVPYRWPELVKFPDATVFVTEGEKDADRVAELGHCATTVAGGKWTDDCAKALAGRDVLILEDNDEPGRKKALAAATALHGTAASVRIVRLPDLPDKGDVSDWLDAHPRRKDELAGVCLAAPVWTPEVAHAQPGEAEAHHDTPGEVAELPRLRVINPADWEGVPVPSREWIVQDFIPAGTVSLLYGDGAVGKSTLALQLAAARALARDWITTVPTPGRTLVLSAEDDDQELHRRLDAVRAHYCAAWAHLSDMRLVDLVGEDAILGELTRNGIISATKLFAAVVAKIEQFRSELVIVDALNDTFAGEENNRTQARQFISMLKRPARQHGCAFLVLAHPSLSGMSTGRGTSGSTGWSNSARARMYLTTAQASDGSEPDPDLRILTVPKANYAPIGTTITLRYQNGVYVPQGGPAALDRLAQEARADDLSSGYSPASRRKAETSTRRLAICTRRPSSRRSLKPRRTASAVGTWPTPCGGSSRTSAFASSSMASHAEDGSGWRWE
jgi:hypothetical protein